MKQLALLLSISFCMYSIAQEHNTSCSKRDKKTRTVEKSASLTVSEIAETERYDVRFYGLDLAMTNQNTSISGTTTILASAKEALDSALIELFPSLSVSQIQLNGQPTTYSRKANKIKIPVNASSGQLFELKIDYSGTPPTASTNPLGGAGMTNASSPSWGNKVTWSLSEPFSAYEWWPCKQSLTDKADSCKVYITVPTACKAGSNGLLKRVTDLGNGKTKYEWEHNHPIDYYLISVSVAEYIDYSIHANPTGAPAPILIQNYIYNNPGTLNNFKSQIDATADFVELFSDLYGLYPFYNEKYGHCMAPISGGMEHQTMTTQGWFENGLTAHELGHQWWGNNVTCKSWADIWINEGFASYSEYLMKEYLFPSQKAQHMMDVHSNVLSNPAGSVWVADTLNDGRIFSGRLTYDKGAGIIHTIRYIINNDSLFFNGLKSFQTKFADSVASGIDFQKHLEEYTGVEFSNEFNQWYFGEGFPIYKVEWNTTPSNLIVRLSQTNASGSSGVTFTNPVDISFSRAGLPDTTIRFNVGSASEQFFIPALKQATGVVAVDPNNWIINTVSSIGKNTNLTDAASVEAVQPEHDIKVYPTPFMDVLIVQHPEELVSNLEVFDLNGNLVLCSSAKETMLNVSHLKAGSYVVRFSDARGTVNQHLIKY